MLSSPRDHHCANGQILFPSCDTAVVSADADYLIILWGLSATTYGGTAPTTVRGYDSQGSKDS